MITPVRTRSASSSGIQSASRTACSAAAMAKRMKLSTLRWSFGAIQSSGLNVPSDPSPRAPRRRCRVARCAGIEPGDLPRPRLPRHQPRPGLLHAAGQRRHHAEPGYDHAPHRHPPLVRRSHRLARKPADGQVASARSPSSPNRDRATETLAVADPVPPQGPRGAEPRIPASAVARSLPAVSSGYRRKISAIPTTTSAAPAHAAAAGRWPVLSQSSGRISTGEVADSVETMPTFPPASA